MKFDIQEWKTDDKKADQGVWIDLGADAAVKVASITDPEFTSEFRKALKPYQSNGRDVPEDVQDEIMVDLVSRYILVNWRGIYDGDDELPYTQENAARLLREIEMIKTRVLTEARNIANFTQDVKGKTSKNSKSA